MPIVGLATIAIPMSPMDFSQKPLTIPSSQNFIIGDFGAGPKKEVAQISALQFRMNNLEEVTEENFCELATKDARMGNIVIGVYRCFIGTND